MGHLGGGKSVEPANPRAVAEALQAVLEHAGVRKILVPLSAMQTMLAMPREFGLQRSEAGGILIAGLPLEVSPHFPEKSSVLALGLS